MKIGGINVLTRCYQGIDPRVLEVIKEIIDEGHIEGWALSDSLAVPINLSCLKHGAELDDCLFRWRFEKNTWVRRTAIAAFIKRARHGDGKPNYAGFMQKLYSLCS